jgi:glycosyltransferase involved in cell wall biosynthesis
VAIVQRHLPHYRRPFFSRLAADNPDIAIRLYHGGEIEGEGAAASAAPSALAERRVRNVPVLAGLGYHLIAQPEVLGDLLRNPPEVVVLEGTFGVVTNMAVLAARRIPRRATLFWSAGWDRPGVDAWRHAIKTQLVRRLVSAADGYIAYGSTARRYLVDHGAEPDRVVIAQNTIDVEAIAARSAEWQVRGAALRDRLGYAGRRVITYVGGISPLKRVPVLIAAYRQLRSRIPDLALLVVGDGPQSAQTRQLCGDLPDVHFAGAVVEGVEAYIAAGDVFALPGTGGLALNQAMALGKPVVATVADGTQIDLIDQGRNGYIAAVDDPDDLAAALGKVLDCNQSGQMGRASLDIVLERASLAGMVASFSNALRAQLSARRGDEALPVP